MCYNGIYPTYKFGHNVISLLVIYKLYEHTLDRDEVQNVTEYVTEYVTGHVTEYVSVFNDHHNLLSICISFDHTDMKSQTNSIGQSHGLYNCEIGELPFRGITTQYNNYKDFY